MQLSRYDWVICSAASGYLQPNVLFQQNAAPPPTHWGLKVRKSVNKTFPKWWIWWDEPVTWPFLSPIKSQVIFVCSYVKYYVQTFVVCLNVMHKSTVQLLLFSPLLGNTWHEVEYRLDILRAPNGTRNLMTSLRESKHFPVPGTPCVFLRCGEYISAALQNVTGSVNCTSNAVTDIDIDMLVERVSCECHS